MSDQTCEHDYRARFQRLDDPVGLSYHAVCNKCGDDAGLVDLSGMTTLSGKGINSNTVQCLDFGWQGKVYQLKAQACPVCDGRVADL